MHQNFLNFVHHDDVVGFERCLRRSARAVSSKKNFSYKYTTISKAYSGIVIIITKVIEGKNTLQPYTVKLVAFCLKTS